MRLGKYDGNLMKDNVVWWKKEMMLKKMMRDGEVDEDFQLCFFGVM